jgi:hypothetical protein
VGAGLISVLRRALFACCFAAAAIGSTCAAFAVASRLEPDAPQTALDVLPLIHRLPARLERSGNPIEPEPRIAYYGDSMLAAGDTIGVSGALSVSLNTRFLRRPVVQVVSIAFPGSNVFDYYSLADVVMQNEPGLVIVPLNLSTLAGGAFLRPQLAGWISVGRLPVALTLPLHWIGLTVDRVLFYSAIVSSGCAPYWVRLVREQVRLGSVRDRVASRLGAASGDGSGTQTPSSQWRALRQWNKGAVDRVGDGHAARYEPAMAGATASHPLLRMLGETVEVFERRGIPVVVYTSPINLEWLERVGPFDADGLATTLESARDVVERAGGRYVDFHALLPEAEFLDRAGHFTLEGERSGAASLGKALARVVANELRERSW